jgi:hypothetical protein
MKEKLIKSKAPLSIFWNKLSYEEYENNVRKLVPYFNQNASKEFIFKMYNLYLSNYNHIKTLSPCRINLSLIGFFSKTQSNIKYWIDRGWDLEEAKKKLKKRQSTCNPEIAKKIQKTLNKKTEEEKKILNKKKGNGLNCEWLMENKSLTKEEALQYIHNKCSYAGKVKNDLYRKLGKAVSNRQLNFYLERGLNIEDAKKELKKRQSLTSLKSYVNKYGEEQGIIKYNQRIEKFKNSWNNKTKEEKREITYKKIYKNKFFSNESYIFFQSLEKKYFEKYDCLYGNNEYFIYDNESHKIYFYDFTILDKKLIIEYHGSHWHANPDKSSKEWKNTLYTYEESLLKDSEKKNAAIKQGFNFYVIWDYQKNDLNVLNNFLNIS